MKKLVLLFTLTMAGLGIAQNKTIKLKVDVTNMKGNELVIGNQEGFEKKIEGDNKGHFEGSFAEKNGLYYLVNPKDGNVYLDLYLKGGDDLKIKMDAKNINESLTFSGKGAEENNFFANRTREEMSFNYDELLSLDETKFNRALAEKREKDKTAINKAKLDPNFIVLLNKAIAEQENNIKHNYVEKQNKLKLNNTMSVSFDYTNYAGGKTKLEDFKGKYVYIDVWATWCAPCRGQIPAMKKMEEKYHNKNIVFVSISIDDAKDLEKWKTFVAENKLAGVQLFSGKPADTDEFMKTYVVNSIPRFILLDPTGKIINSDAPWPSDPSLEFVLEPLI